MLVAAHYCNTNYNLQPTTKFHHCPPPTFSRHAQQLHPGCPLWLVFHQAKDRHGWNATQVAYRSPQAPTRCVVRTQTKHCQNQPAQRKVAKPSEEKETKTIEILLEKNKHVRFFADFGFTPWIQFHQANGQQTYCLSVKFTQEVLIWSILQTFGRRRFKPVPRSISFSFEAVGQTRAFRRTGSWPTIMVESIALHRSQHTTGSDRTAQRTFSHPRRINGRRQKSVVSESKTRGQWKIQHGSRRQFRFSFRCNEIKHTSHGVPWTVAIGPGTTSSRRRSTFLDCNETQLSLHFIFSKQSKTTSVQQWSQSATDGHWKVAQRKQHLKKNTKGLLVLDVWCVWCTRVRTL